LKKTFNTITVDKSKIPGEEWTYNHNDTGYDGVNTFEQKLAWFKQKTEGMQAPKSTRYQTFEEFMRDGPLDDDLPTDIMLDLYELIINAID